MRYSTEPTSRKYIKDYGFLVKAVQGNNPAIVGPTGLEL